ncbi:ammonium transporter [candidate division KSB3 bacterium]|uniref:Ammonium transporter n=1 Tax=candidate division KSB3 bacterium TaxID=2044937 RepID=A0A9D5JU63_9BACT|nr:ammonium transporter [candidate division KSB3 bacterium]
MKLSDNSLAVKGQDRSRLTRRKHIMVKSKNRLKLLMCLGIIVLGTGMASVAHAQDAGLNALTVAVDTLWVMVAAFLVFFMNLGFGMVESGLCRAKNTVNILAKNFIVFAIASISFWVIGWGLMFGNGNSLLGLEGLFFASGADNSPAIGDAYQGAYQAIGWAGVPFWAKFFFQLVFAGTAATIVSGVVAERIKFVSFIIFSFLMVGVMYPVTGHWIWGGGWLQNLGMWDFAGSTVVHSVGGWAGLAGALLLGPRLDKYRQDGSVRPVYGHNMSMVTLGGLVLWFGWFGFNPGSTMGVGDGSAIAHIAVTTNTAAAAAILGATLTAWMLEGKPDLSMIVNGALAGLVAITAPCAFVGVGSAAIIGILAGILVVFAVLLFDRLHIDDPVGALSVHLVNGIFGTLAVGLFAQDGITGAATGDGLFFGGGFSLLGSQFIGVLSVGVFTFVSALIGWSIVKSLWGIRVTRDEELRGLDIGEHGMEAYAGFQIFSNQ